MVLLKKKKKKINNLHLSNTLWKMPIPNFRYHEMVFFSDFWCANVIGAFHIFVMLQWQRSLLYFISYSQGNTFIMESELKSDPSLDSNNIIQPFAQNH